MDASCVYSVGMQCDHVQHKLNEILPIMIT